MKKHLVVAVLFALALAAPALAQTPPAGGVADPRYLQFAVSPDHNGNMLDGKTPLVTRYEWRVFAYGTPLPIITIVDLGKPAAPNGATVIFDSTAACASLPNCTPMATLFATVAKGQWDASVVAAIGPGGEGVSLTSNPFGLNKTNPGAATGVAIK